MTLAIVCFGRSGHGKSALALALREKLRCNYVNGDQLRASPISSDLSFSHEDRIMQARRIAAIGNLVLAHDPVVILDFICPTHQTRTAFTSELNHSAYLIYLNKGAERTKVYREPFRFDEPGPFFKPDATIGEWNEEELPHLVNYLFDEVLKRGQPS